MGVSQFFFASLGFRFRFLLGWEYRCFPLSVICGSAPRSSRIAPPLGGGGPYAVPLRLRRGGIPIHSHSEYVPALLRRPNTFSNMSAALRRFCFGSALRSSRIPACKGGPIFLRSGSGGSIYLSRRHFHSNMSLRSAERPYLPCLTQSVDNLGKVGMWE